MLNICFIHLLVIFNNYFTNHLCWISVESESSRAYSLIMYINRYEETLFAFVLYCNLLFYFPEINYQKVRKKSMQILYYNKISGYNIVFFLIIL